MWSAGAQYMWGRIDVYANEEKTLRGFEIS